jgi:hypothetical protein
MRMPVTLTLTLAAAGLFVAVGTATAGQLSSTITTRSADAIERSPGRAGTEVFWTDRTDVGVPQVVQQTYGNTRTILANPSPVTDPDRFGRGGGYVGLDKFHAIDWQTRTGMTSPDAG